jgi:hypothetical protein
VAYARGAAHALDGQADLFHRTTHRGSFPSSVW